jgi:N4-gp56 family major capsid protein
VSKNKLSDYFSSYFDQSGITTVAGARGSSTELLIPMGATGAVEGGSDYSTYDSNHIVYGGAANAKSTLTSADKMTLDTVDRIITRVTSTGGGADGKVRLNPLNKNGEEAYVMQLSPRQEHDLRKDVGTGGWMDLQKASAGAEGKNSHLFKNTLGVHRGVHLRKHQHTVQFKDYGAGQNLRADRAVFMGRQACAVAFGSAASKGLRASWVEEEKDFGNRLGVVAGMVYSFKLPKFNGEVINSIAVDTAVSTDF